MKTTGLFHLRGRPVTVRMQSPGDSFPTAWLLPLCERHSQRGVQMLTAYWRGEEADQFMAAHPGLKAGDSLQLDLDRLHAWQNEVYGFVTACALAPERWPERAPEREADAPAARAIDSVAACARVTGAAATFHQ